MSQAYDPYSDDELYSPNEIAQMGTLDEDLVSFSELTGSIPSAGKMGKDWANMDLNGGLVTKDNYMERAAERVQEYQQERMRQQSTRLTANEQVAIVDAYRQMAGIQPEGYYRTATGAAVPKNLFQEIRRKRVEDSNWENFKANLSSTALQNLAAIRAAQAKITDALGITDDALSEAARDSEEVNAILQPGGGKAGFAGRAVGNMMNLFLGRAGGLAPHVGAPAMFAYATAGYTFIDVNRRREAGQKISPTTEWTSAIANATIEYAMETFGQAVASRAGSVLAGRVSTLRRAITHNGLRGGIRAAAGALTQFAVQGVGLAAEGAAEEAITEILQNTVRRVGYAPEQKTMENVWEAALQGALMPIMAAPGMAAIQTGRPGGRFRQDIPQLEPGEAVQQPREVFRAIAESRLMDAQPLAKLVQAEQMIEAKRSFPNMTKAELADLAAAQLGQDPSTLKQYSKGALIRAVTEQYEQSPTGFLDRAIQAEAALPEALQVRLPAETDIPAVQTSSKISQNDLFNKWIGDRQLADKAAVLAARRHQVELKGLTRDGEQATQIDNAIAVYIDMQEYGDQYTVENIEKLTPKQQDLIVMAQTLSPEQRTFARTIIAENKALGIEAMEAGIIKSFKENYSAKIFKTGRGKAKAKFTIATARARQRTLPSLIAGWARGLELAAPGAIEAQMLARQQIAQVIHDRNFVTAGLKSGLFSTKRDGEHTHRVEHPNFAKWIWAGQVGTEVPIGKPGGKPTQTKKVAKLPEAKAEEEGVATKPAKIYGPDVFVDAEGIVRRRAKMWASKQGARHLNNALGSSALYSIPGVGTITKFNSAVKHMILTASFFHHFAYLRSYMLASRGVNPVTAYRKGREAVDNFIPELQEIVHEGLTFGEIQDFTPAIEEEITAIGKVIDKVPIASEIRSVLKQLSRWNTNLLFGKMGPYLKVQAALLEYRAKLKHHDADIKAGKITREQVARDVSNLMNDDFGGLNLQRMGRNPTQQHIFRLLALAPDWTESNIRTMAKAFKLGHEGQVYRAMWGRVLLKGLGATVLFNLLMATQDDEKDFWERYKFAWEKGNFRWLDVDITPLARKLGGQKGSRKYFSILGHFKDPLKFIRYTGRSAKNKSSVLGRMIIEGGTGTDWRGREFTTFGELMRTGDAVQSVPYGGGPVDYQQFPSYMIKQAEKSTPIQAQAALQLMRGEIDMFDWITRSTGLNTTFTFPKKRKGRKRPTRKRRRRRR